MEVVGEDECFDERNEQSHSDQANYREVSLKTNKTKNCLEADQHKTFVYFVLLLVEPTC